MVKNKKSNCGEDVDQMEFLHAGVNVKWNNLSVPYKLKRTLLCRKISEYFQVFSKENENIGVKTSV